MDSAPRSDHGHFSKKIKRNNLVSLFLDGIEAEKYINTHNFGNVAKVDNAGDTMNSIAIHDLSRFQESLLGRSSFDAGLFKATE